MFSQFAGALATLKKQAVFRCVQEYKGSSTVMFSTTTLLCEFVWIIGKGSRVQFGFLSVVSVQALRKSSKARHSLSHLCTKLTVSCICKVGPSVTDILEHGKKSWHFILIVWGTGKNKQPDKQFPPLLITLAVLIFLVLLWSVCC